MADIDAIEVRENQRLNPRYGDGKNLSFPSLILKEKEVSSKCGQFIEENRFPLMIQKLIDFGTFDDEENKDAQLSDFFVVLRKAKSLIDEGFHVMIVIAMLGCANGRKSQLGYGEFDAKFTRAFTDLDVRKDFWETEYLLPIQLVRAFLIDLMRHVLFDDFCAEEVNIGAFIKFCNA